MQTKTLGYNCSDPNLYGRSFPAPVHCCLNAFHFLISDVLPQTPLPATLASSAQTSIQVKTDDAATSISKSAEIAARVEGDVR